MHWHCRLEIPAGSSSLEHNIHLDSLCGNAAAIRIRLDSLRSETDATRIGHRTRSRAQRIRFNRTDPMGSFWNYVRSNIRHRMDHIPSRRSLPRRDRRHFSARQNLHRHGGLYLPAPGADRFKWLPIRHPYNQCGNRNLNVPLRFLLDCTHDYITYRSDLLSGNNAGMDSYHQQCGAHPRCQHGSNILSSDRDSSHGWTIHHVQPQEATVNQVEVSRSPHTRHSKRASVNKAPFQWLRASITMALTAILASMFALPSGAYLTEPHQD